ncbi:MAG: hypothetical protein IPG00_13230 [Saprospiraceae bacterium]|nr:hypothetical protein [Saprospiraceae bacterium]
MALESLTLRIEGILRYIAGKNGVVTHQTREENGAYVSKEKDANSPCFLIEMVCINIITCLPFNVPREIFSGVPSSFPFPKNMIFKIKALLLDIINLKGKFDLKKFIYE